MPAIKRFAGMATGSLSIWSSSVDMVKNGGEKAQV